jgi:hypothetical protein
MYIRSSGKAWFCGLGILLWAMTALAHHSGAMFDEKQLLSLTGTVREFQWHNPHCYIQLVAPLDTQTGRPDHREGLAAAQGRQWRPGH